MVTKKIENPADSFDKTLDQVVELLEGEEQQFIYLTGAAGTGKTTLIERVVDECSLKKMVVAPTGVAALNIGGSTINSAFRIGLSDVLLNPFDNWLSVSRVLPNCRF